MAGTPQKMLEHLLETRLDGRGVMPGGETFILNTAQDPFLDDFLLTHVVIDTCKQEDREFALACKRRVVHFVYRWVSAVRHPVFEDEAAADFIAELADELEEDVMRYGALEEEAAMMHHVMTQLRRFVILQT
nr:unnamed protein product [Callosobruchus analis]